MQRSDEDDDFLYVNEYCKPFKVSSSNYFLTVDGHLNNIDADDDRFDSKAIKCIIHTHSPYTSLSLIKDVQFYIGQMDVIAFYEDVQVLPVWPGIYTI